MILKCASRRKRFVNYVHLNLKYRLPHFCARLAQVWVLWLCRACGPLEKGSSKTLAVPLNKWSSHQVLWPLWIWFLWDSSSGRCPVLRLSLKTVCICIQLQIPESTSGRTWGSDEGWGRNPEPKPPTVTHCRCKALHSAAICLNTNCEEERGNLQKGF